jgi:hypothetical protein
MNTATSEDVFEFDAKSHVYKLNGKKLTGVTTILGVINKPALVGWAARVAVEHIKENIVYKRLKLLRKGYIVIKEKSLAEAQVAHTRKKEAGGAKGTDAHALVEEYVGWCIELGGNAQMPTVAHYVERWSPLQLFIEWAIKANIRFLASEKRFYSKSLFVAGTADILFEKDGKRYVGDVKTFKKLWDRTPMFQCAGYALLAEEMGEPKFDGYCVLRLSEDGSFECCRS